MEQERERGRVEDVGLEKGVWAERKGRRQERGGECMLTCFPRGGCGGENCQGVRDTGEHKVGERRGAVEG